jgi:inorganic pyrophosphatase
MTLTDKIKDLTERLADWRASRDRWAAALKTHTNYENWNGVSTAEKEIARCDEKIAALRSELDQARRQDAIEATL